MKKNALMYCGRSERHIGNLHRAIGLADKLSETFKVTVLVDEDTPILVNVPESVRLVRLPALSVDPDSNVFEFEESEQLRTSIVARRDVILAEFERLKPRLVVVDSFPFYQHRLRGEILPMIERARNGIYGESLVVCTTDSIIADESAGSEERADIAAAILDKYFDVILVESDPVFARLEEFFKPCNTLHTPVYHIGFVTPEEGPLPDEREERILVSAGDGRYGGALFRAAVGSQRVLHPRTGMPMTIVTGPRLPESEYQDIVDRARRVDGLTIKRVVRSMRDEVFRARYSVSQCGYHTALNAITTQTPSLFVPCEERSRREQIVRAQRLVYWGAGRLLMPRHLNTASLTNEINQLLHFESRSVRFDLDGAANAARLVGGANRFGQIGVGQSSLSGSAIESRTLRKNKT